MSISLFKQKPLANYKKQLTRQLLGSKEDQPSTRPELEESYIPSILFKYYALEQDYNGVCKRKFWPLDKMLAGEKLWIIGKPGAGKTTFLKKLALLLIQDELNSDKLPVYIYLKSIVQNKQNLLDDIGHIFETLGYAEPSKFIKKKLQEGKLALLLDGLDEIADPIQTQKILAKTNQFLSEYGKYANTLLIASRFTQYSQDLKGVECATLSGLNEPQIQKHINSKLCGVIPSPFCTF